MDVGAVLIAVLTGLLQGIFEWLPISSEGNITIVMTLLGGVTAGDAVAFSLFLHAGTAISATVYYRAEFAHVIRTLPDWRSGTAFDDATAELSYLIIATLMTGVVGLPAYLLLDEVVTKLQGGVLIILIGVLLIATGVLQRLSGDLSLGGREQPDLFDALLVGGMQGLAVLPGVSRSGVTASALLFPSHDGSSAFNLSFLLSIPAALGGTALAFMEAGGFPAIAPTGALIALLVSAIVGYLTIDALLRVVERISFGSVCLGLGGLALLGGGLLVVIMP